ncbi:MAG: hypothetical protein ACMVY4_16080 [Minwuia sp.]|uniref:hypothetical protein n=1 Tax=Minwuia sp. TaxID=2493630 RepID=UPI003A8ADF31
MKDVVRTFGLTVASALATLPALLFGTTHADDELAWSRAAITPPGEWIRAESDYPQKLSIHARYTIERYKQEPFPLALVVAPDGGYATYWRCSDAHCSLDDQVYVQKALKACRERAHIGECLVHSIRHKQVWPVPVVYEADIRARLITPWHHQKFGPEQAKGAIVHVPGFAGHRFPTAMDHPLTPFHLSQLNKEGYDTFRLNIAHYDYSRTDRPELNRTLKSTVRQLRREGYRKVFLNGQSRGAWEILAASSEDLGIDGAMLFVPAAHGRAESWDGSPSRRFRQSAQDFRQLIAAAGRERFLFAFFRGDEYDPGGRAETLMQIRANDIGSKIAVLDGPDNLAGHGAAGRIAFYRQYGTCLSRFLEGEEVDFDTCRTPFALNDELDASTEAHILELGGMRLKGKELDLYMDNRAVFPAIGTPGWWGFHARTDGSILQWFPGRYLTGNTLESHWRIDGDAFCIIDSPRQNSNFYCYDVYRMPDGKVGLVAPDGLAVIARTETSNPTLGLSFQPGDWEGKLDGG